ncbi:MAG: hypothetical protein Fur003_1350 [Candidatus Dojkabacteria bacterium]
MYVIKTMAKIKIEKRFLVLLATIAGVIVLFIIAWIIFAPKQPDLPAGGIDQGLPFNEARDIEIPNDVILSKDPKEYKTYKVLDVDHSSQIREFLLQNGKGNLKEAHPVSFDYTWGTYGSETEDYVTYNTITDSAALIFNYPLEIDQVSAPILNEKEAEQIALKLLNRFFKSKYEFVVVRSEKEDRDFRVHLSRKLDGLNLVLPGIKDYSESLLFNPSGKLLAARISLVEYDSPFKVDMLPFDQLGSYINSDIYPKEYNEGGPIDFDYSLLEGNELNYGDAPTPEAEVPTTDGCVADHVELVYYFDTHSQKYLAPTYRINCTGTITVKGRSFDVPVVVYANAIDPDFVYVPGGAIQ